MKSRGKNATVNGYIQSFPAPTRKILRDLRRVIKKSAPQAREKIAYGIPTLEFYENLVHFAAYDTHIGFYPTSSGIKAFRKDLSRYSTARGTVRFPIEKRLPFGLIRRIVIFRVKEVLKERQARCARGHRFRRSRARPVCSKCWPGYYRRKGSV